MKVILKKTWLKNCQENSRMHTSTWSRIFAADQKTPFARHAFPGLLWPLFWCHPTVGGRRGKMAFALQFACDQVMPVAP
jgi:hypothetical protein